MDEYEDVESCRLAIKHLQSVVGELEPGLHRAEGNTWSWLLSRDGRTVAVSGHRYDRLIRCRQGLAHFVVELAACEIGAGLMLTQARRWSALSGRALVERRRTHRPLGTPIPGGPR